jgi:hypothetical protein
MTLRKVKHQVHQNLGVMGVVTYVFGPLKPILDSKYSNSSSDAPKPDNHQYKYQEIQYKYDFSLRIDAGLVEIFFEAILWGPSRIPRRFFSSFSTGSM